MRTDSDVLLALASFHRRSWRRLFCRRLCGGGDCDGGGRDGLSAALQHAAAGRAAGSQRGNAVVAAVRTDLDVLLALASLHRHSWRRLFCRRLCGGDVEPSVRPGSYPAFLALSHVVLPAPYIMSSLWQVCFQSTRRALTQHHSIWMRTPVWARGHNMLNSYAQVRHCNCACTS